MKNYPDEQECLNLLKKAGCSEEVINHSKAVKENALKISAYTNAKIDLILAGALLHDIGRSKTHGIFHAIEGVKIAKKLGLSKDIICIIERHIGAGLSAEVAKRLGLPKKDYIPITLEEKIVCHADNLVDNCKFQKIGVEVERALRDGLKEYAIRMVKLHKELSDICGFDLDNLK